MSSRGMPAISVVVATFNGAKYIGDQLQSIVGQSVLPTKIIVCDDGSTDSTLEIVDNYLSQVGSIPFSILEGARTPIGATRNFERGIARVDTPILALCDQDDIWGSRRLEVGAQVLLTDAHAVLCAGNASIVDDAGDGSGESVYSRLRLTRSEKTALAEDRYLDVLLRRNIWPGMTYTMRSQFALDLPPAPAGWMHDYWFAICASARSGLRIVDDAHVRYRLHDGNHIGMQRTKAVLRELHLLRWLLSSNRRESRAAADKWVALQNCLVSANLLTAEAAQKIEDKVLFENMRIPSRRVSARQLRGRLTGGEMKKYIEFDSDGLGAFLADLALAANNRRSH